MLLNLVLLFIMIQRNFKRYLHLNNKPTQSQLLKAITKFVPQ